MNRERQHRAALLWDESFLWGIMAYHALAADGLAFDLLRSDDIKQGALDGYGMLFVPGGWASNKIKSLGDAGVEAIRHFVRDGGHYVGFCGGAGLATEEGIGLLPVKRRPTRERVPSFSGPIRLTTAAHPIWDGIADPCFYAWWPSQFVVDQSVSVLASYGSALPGAFSSDVNVGDTETAGSWTELERVYGINLDPGRLLNEPAVVEGRFGKGRVLLSLVHFDTPNDPNGSLVLGNIWRYLQAEIQRPLPAVSCPVHGHSANVTELLSTVSSLIDLGQRNFLWFWRNPLLLQWRRGVRGLEYCTLYGMVREIARLEGLQTGRELTGIDQMQSRLNDFADKAKQLLVRERHAMQHAHITYEQCEDSSIRKLREELFSRSKSHGGLFKEVLDDLDGILYAELRRETECR